MPLCTAVTPFGFKDVKLKRTVQILEKDMSVLPKEEPAFFTPKSKNYECFL